MPSKQMTLDFGPHASFLDRQAANEARGHSSLFKARERDDFYSSKGWRRARGACFAKNGARCAQCGSTAKETTRLDCDHIVPRSRAPHLALYVTNLQILCEACHESKTYRDQLRAHQITNCSRSRSSAC